MTYLGGTPRGNLGSRRGALPQQPARRTSPTAAAWPCYSLSAWSPPSKSPTVLSINVILPDMQGNVGASSDQISWVIILYNVGFLCSLALSAWMTRVLGTRRHLLISIGFYAVGAIGCALSTHSLEQLLISRLIMGFGGGAFLVRVIILAGLMFPGKSAARGRHLALRRAFSFRGPLSHPHGLDHRYSFTGITPSWLIFPFWPSALFSSGN